MDSWTSGDGRIIICHADAKEFLPTLAAESVDAFVTDPPYGIPIGSAFVRDGGAVVDDGNETMNVTSGDSVWFLEEALRALVPGGHLATFHARQDRSHVEARMLEAGLTPWQSFYLINSAPPCTPRPTFSSAVQECQIGLKQGGTRRWFGGGATPNVYIGIPGTREQDRSGHTAQKPLGCMKRLCSALAPVGGLVCDPFLGSGTTAVACVQLGQRFVGCEREREWFENSVERVRMHLAEKGLDPGVGLKVYPDGPFGDLW